MQCTRLPTENMFYYNFMHSDTFGCLLDCSKAFDRVCVRTVFTKLLNIDAQIKNKTRIKRGIAIGQIKGVMQRFHFAHPATKYSLM